MKVCAQDTQDNVSKLAVNEVLRILRFARGEGTDPGVGTTSAGPSGRSIPDGLSRSRNDAMPHTLACCCTPCLQDSDRQCRKQRFKREFAQTGTLPLERQSLQIDRTFKLLHTRPASACFG